MSNSYVTIITQSHLSYAMAMFESLLLHSKVEFDFHCLIAENEIAPEVEKIISSFHTSFIPIKLNQIEGPFFQQIYDKYFLEKKNEFRWSMKPVAINYLLSQKKYDKVIYLDADLYFFNAPDFLFKLLDKDKVLLSPHWRCSHKPELDWFNFVHNFKHGIYNGGFIGVNYQGQEVMDYWANLCLAACEQNALNGLHDDQKYLDIFQSYFEGVGVLRHRGCNVSNWNRVECRRSNDSHGNTYINETFPIVFIHFTDGTNTEILKGNDEYLLPFFNSYAKHLNQIDPALDLIKLTNLSISQQQQNSTKIAQVQTPWWQTKINHWFK